ncbi:alpha/beta fold hydrolase [Nocardia sp. NPDC051030]|uniref:alpha/beta hydrolase family protein n=1 Tax=Nocardia sp. NPDC051030 TaxID=3155162 RepID=UPI003425017D
MFSHGNGWSMDGYEPLVDRWAAAGFVVVQPTHLDSRRHGIGFDNPIFGTIWRVRIADLHAVLDNLDDILARAAGLDARIDHDQVAVVGHSWGAQTAGTLLGARVLDSDGNAGEDFTHAAVKAGVLIAATGTGDTLTPFAAEHLPFMRPDYSAMSTPTLVIAGGKDQSAMSTRGPDWFTDAYHFSPGAKSLLTIATDENPARVALVADAVSAYLLDTFDHDYARWAGLSATAAVGDEAFSVDDK